MTEDTRVLYNADCPVCSFEIDHYAKYSAGRALPIRFEDLNCVDMTDWGLSRDEAARRLYVLRGGQMYSGVPAFIVLWQDMPRYRWLARIVSLPGLHWLASKAYDHVLAPLIYQWHLRRQAAATSTES
ncbi:thiol-disulfide oxidoreductase DCC family protein [uncultured Tateyamaria sp.]|uniref:thiol-disulfide oxidoreductase DCC family protein n=1 Tax=uncultured Tateyamaria sp. TaxID=455651 RepID=UPI002637D49C|nr:DUF393 domain-containing protein [uncultured Tateyamaria sp.]